MNSITLLCTGFHRSATSLVAQLLHAGGLNMGSRLMIPHRSNPDGHFEDAELVNLHDAALQEQGTSLNLTDDVPVVETAALRLRMTHYVNARDALSPVGWGVKDPRLCLFLPFWANALGDRGRFVLVARHWAASLQSMLKRHSRLLAEQHSVSPAQMPALQKDHLVYWHSGQLPRMWLAYAERMLQFAQQHPGVCLVLPHAAVLAGAPLHTVLAQRWGVELTAPAKPVVKHHLISDAVDARIEALVSPALRERLDAVWAQLAALAAPECAPWLDASWAQPNWVSQPDDPALPPALALAQAHWGSSPRLGGWARAHAARPDRVQWTSADALVKSLNQAETLGPADLQAALDWLATHEPDNGAAWRELGRRALAASAADLAEQAFWRAASAGPAPAEVWALLAHVHQLRGEPSRALHHWREAARRNPKNGHFAAGVVRAHAACGLQDQATLALDAMANMPPDWPTISLWTQLMQEMGRGGEVLKRVEELAHAQPDRAEQWAQLRARLLLAEDTAEALRLQDAATRARLSEANLGALLAGWLERVDGQAETTDLATRLLAHWRDVLGSDGLASRLNAAEPTPGAMGE